MGSYFNPDTLVFTLADTDPEGATVSELTASLVLPIGKNGTREHHRKGH